MPITEFKTYFEFHGDNLETLHRLYARIYKIQIGIFRIFLQKKLEHSHILI